MKRVLLTGARGFIGRYAVGPLVARGYEVHAVTTRAVPADIPDVQWHRADLLVPDDVAALVARVRPSHLLHLAWYVEPGRFWTSPENLRWVGATLEVVRAFREAGGARAVLAGTCAEYAWGEGDGRCIEGTTPLRPGMLYGVSKDAVRRVVARYAEDSGLSAAWGRVFLLYGPHEPAGRLVPAVIRALLRGDPARCSHGRQVRDLLHVADVADAFAALLDSPVDGAVNIASGAPVALGDVAREAGRQLRCEALVQLGAIPAPPGDPDALTADVTRLQVEVGWTPRYDLARGLDDTIAWWRSRLGSAAAGASVAR